MGIELSSHQYGKSETRVVRIDRDSERHEIHDLNVTTTLVGDFAAAYLDGDQSQVLPTDSQKNACYAFARAGVGQIEDYALTLARHFVDDVEPVTSARISVQEYAWQRAVVDGVEHDHTWVRQGSHVRTATVTVDGSGPGRRTVVESGLCDLVLLKSTGSEFAGFLTDPYTTLEPTHDRIMATSLVATWRHARDDDAESVDLGTAADWAASHASVCDVLVSQFATVHSLALQQTLWHMGRAVLQRHPGIEQISLSAPNKHHFAVDLTPFGLDNPGQVFHAADRPYGLIECTVTRDSQVDSQVNS